MDSGGCPAILSIARRTSPAAARAALSGRLGLETIRRDLPEREAFSRQTFPHVLYASADSTWRALAARRRRRLYS